MSQPALTKEAVQKALEEFQDPETGRSVVALGQVHDLEVSDSKLVLNLGLTTYSAPLWHQTQTEAADFLRARFPGLSHVSVHLAVHERPG